MIKWEKYIKWGDFISTNKIPLKFKWEFDRLNDYEKDKNIILTSILCLAYPYDIVSIYTINPKILEKYCKAIYYPNTNISDGFVDDKYIIYDDVVTTEKTMIKAIEKYGKKPEKCICIVDRRDESIQHMVYELDVISIKEVLLCQIKELKH